MEPRNDAIILRARKRVFWILHFAFMAAVLVYTFLAYTFLSSELLGEGAKTLTDLQAPALALIVLSLASVAGGYLIPARIKVPGSDSDSVLDRLAALQTRMIITDAFFESIAIYGLIGVFMGMGQGLRMSLMALSFILLALQIPRFRGWLDEIDREYGEPGRGGRW